ncbi:hypothetical protein [Brucella intermedia]|uniref:hypothetical protein n=1 Tax=Brucella intermedia TaxID=94625 RepID=UPI002360D3F5|nr:hypothetical protein [Brucella intermedia]
MPSKERRDLIETVAQKMQEKWSGGHINWDRLHGQLKKDYLDIAEVAADTILAALKDPSEHMLAEAMYLDRPVYVWRAMLNASALGEKDE